MALLILFFIDNLLAIAFLDWLSVHGETAAFELYIVVENLVICLVNL